MSAYYYSIQEYAQNEVEDKRRKASVNRLQRMARQQRRQELAQDLQSMVNGLLERRYRRRTAAEAR